MATSSEHAAWDRLASAVNACGERGQDFPASLKADFCDSARAHCMRWLSRQLPYEMAEDVSQEVVARALRSLRSFRGDYRGRSLVAWLNTIITNELYSFRERNSRRRERETSFPADDERPLRAAPARSPAEEAEARDLGLRLQQEVQRLPDVQRRAFQLHHLGGQPFRTVAEMLGISEAAAKMAASRATRTMQATLSKYAASRTTTGL